LKKGRGRKNEIKIVRKREPIKTREDRDREIEKDIK
jgi:hypothetical protein